ncbi:cytochrome c oxidase subunit II [Flindersiella endophytica]
MVSLAAVALLLGSGCSAQSAAEWKRVGMPEPATDRADHALSLWQGTWIAALAVGVLVWGLIIWSVIAYRKRSEAVPAQTRYHVPIETLFTVVPFIIIAVLFFFTVRDQNAILHVDKTNPPTYQVNAVGQQWAWTFNYTEKGQPKEEGTWETGTPADLPTLYLPVDERVGVTLTTPDVIHSFFVPAFLFKMDVIPGKPNYFEFTPTKEGVFDGKCAELCGAYHSRMLFEVHVVSKAEYQQHLADLKERGQTGQAEGAPWVQPGHENAQDAAAAEGEGTNQ